MKKVYTLETLSEAARAEFARRAAETSVSAIARDLAVSSPTLRRAARGQAVSPVVRRYLEQSLLPRPAEGQPA